MTTEELAAIEVEIMSDPTLQSGEVKRYMTLVAEVRRLRNLVMEAFEEGQANGVADGHGKAHDGWSMSYVRKEMEGA
jgi:hypothetical protein